MNPDAILNTITAAMLTGGLKYLLDVYRTLAIHEEKHHQHDQRLNKLESTKS